MTKLTEIYDKKFFEWHRPLREDYRKITQYLNHHLEGRHLSILDIGCGNAYFLEAFPSFTLKFGIEGSHHCLPEVDKHIKSRIRILDVSVPFFVDNVFDLVICTEVAEHLPVEAADTLINNIFNHAGRDVFFSAATPGQGGHHHLNEQPHEYWIEKFKDRGFAVDEDRTKRVREFAATTQLSWIRDNAIILRVNGC